MSAELDRAFQRAADARRAIRTVVDDVRSGALDLPGAFERAEADSLTARCFAVKVFEAVPGIGKVRARRTMEDLGLDEGIWLGDVPSSTRAAVMAAFDAPESANS